MGVLKRRCSVDGDGSGGAVGQVVASLFDFGDGVFTGCVRPGRDVDDAGKGGVAVGVGECVDRTCRARIGSGEDEQPAAFACVAVCDGLIVAIDHGLVDGDVAGGCFGGKGVGDGPRVSWSGAGGLDGGERCVGDGVASSSGLVDRVRAGDAVGVGGDQIGEGHIAVGVGGLDRSAGAAGRFRDRDEGPSGQVRRGHGVAVFVDQCLVGGDGAVGDLFGVGDVGLLVGADCCGERVGRCDRCGR